MKLGWDPIKKICKGFAFVTMASEVRGLGIATDEQEGLQAALELHGTSYGKRRLKVEKSDPNFANKKASK